MQKLYRRNPVQWRRGGRASAEEPTHLVFRRARVPIFHELNKARGVDSVRLAFDDDFDGDRVLALVAGLASMVEAAYNNRREFFVLDELSPQKLYNCARNIETAAWLLRSRVDANGVPLLLSNSRTNPQSANNTRGPIDTAGADPENLSFERLFGKLIAQQDIIARFIADRTNRVIRHITQGLASVVFLPV